MNKTVFDFVPSGSVTTPAGFLAAGVTAGFGTAGRPGRCLAGKSPERALRKALTLGVLFTVGTAGLVHTFFGPAAWITGFVALSIASFGSYQVYRSECS